MNCADAGVARMFFWFVPVRMAVIRSSVVSEPAAAMTTPGGGTTAWAGAAVANTAVAAPRAAALYKHRFARVVFTFGGPLIGGTRWGRRPHVAPTLQTGCDPLPCSAMRR